MRYSTKQCQIYKQIIKTLHYIRNLHLGAIVLNIINISVTAKNGPFFYQYGKPLSYSQFSNVTLFGPNGNT